MEENVTPNSDVTPSAEGTPNAETSSMESGGEMYDGSKKLGFIGIMLLGLTSIYYYRKNVESLKKGQLELKQIKQDIDAMKQKFANATGNRTRYGRLA